MVDIHIKNGEIFVKSEYDRNIVTFMRSRPKRFWNTTTREWKLPESDLDLLIASLSDYEYNIRYDDSDNLIQDSKNANIPNSIPDWYEFKTKPFQHQIDGVNYGLQHPKFLLADEQGCIDGDMIVSYNVSGASKTCSLSELYTVYSKSKVKNKFKVRCLKDGFFGLSPILDVVFSGKKDVFKVTLENGKSVNATFDHEVLTDNGFTCVCNLKVGDMVATNGDVLKCIECGSTDNIITYKYSKFVGYCKKCMYKLRDGKLCKGDQVYKHIGTDGYVYLYGRKFRDHPRYTSIGLLEHVYVAENMLGRPLNSDEQVHHKNKIRTDNRPENLQVLNKRDHSLIHNCETHFHKDFIHRNGNEVIMIPKYSPVVSIEFVGEKDTYDIKMSDPYHNFIANKIVVHNCGKSKQMLDLSQILKKESNIKHTLIIACVNSLKYNWQAEVEKHTNDKGYILGTRYLKNGREIIGSNEDRLSDIKDIGKGGQIDDYYYIITNIETLRYNKSIKVPMKTKKNGVQRFKKQTVFPIVEALQEQIDAGNISMIIADEIHKCKSENSLQGRALLALDCDYKAALTGTPVMNQPIDLYTVLNWLGFEEHSAFAFKKHYCIMGGFGQHQIVGYKNLPELQSILDKCMLRRLKSDVLDLPEKIYINDYVEMTKAQIKLYDEVRNNLIENIDKIKLSPNPLVQLIRLRQVTGNPSILSSSINDNPKFSRMCEIIEDAIENGGKVLVFSNWTDVIEPAYELVKSMKYKKDGKDKRYNPAIYTGQNKDVREQEKDRFMNDPDCKVLLGTMGAMGTGLTLTAANTVIFLDEPWNRAIKDQCEDRVHRIGTKESPNIITIMCKGTIDERINDLVYKKGKMSDVLIDKEEDMTRNPKVVNYLLSLD